MLSAPPSPAPASSLDEATRRLDAWFAECPAAAVAFSGGVDSALVAYWARRALGRDRATAWMANSPSLKRSDLALARTFCVTHDIALRELATGELENPAYASNPIDRCYHCKNTLYTDLAHALAAAGSTAWICSGANLDDRGDYRPGLRAAAEARVRHPLLECGLGKQLIRELARAHGLAVWDKPATPCLSSRIPYGQPVTREKLSQIEAAEAWLHAAGFPINRVRHFGERAVIEVPASEIARLETVRNELDAQLTALGFAAFHIDPDGFASGKLNRGLVSAAA